MAPIEDTRKISDLTVSEFNEAVRDAVAEAFKDVGVPIEDKEDRKAAQADFLYLRKLRTTFDAAAATVGKSIITGFVIVFVGIVSWLLTNFVVNK